MTTATRISRDYPLDHKLACILAKKLHDGELVLFAGAGLSHLATAKDGSDRRIPLWAGLTQAVASHFGFKALDFDDSPLDLFDAVIHSNSRGELERVVTATLDDRDFELSFAHHALSELPWHKIITTNYDALLCRLFEESYPITDEAGYDRLNEAKIIQLHGKLPQPHTLTRDDYRLWTKKNPRAVHTLQSFIQNRTLLFVGYSLSDPHLDEILALAREWTKDREKRLYGLFWQIPQAKQNLLNNRDKITAASIDTPEEWLNALCQIKAELNHLNTSASINPVTTGISYRESHTVLIKQICEEVDFLTPIEEPYFYLGVDVQPGHLAAGLVVERPAARQRTIKALEARRNVLIVGPSGSGKSALMWEVAKAASYVDKWFRIRRLSSDQVHFLMDFANVCRASAERPIGFVLDDIGCGLSEGWDALSREAALLPGVTLLGSAREEDLFSLTERDRAIEIREIGDNELAERLWKELRSRSQTQSIGWREPWRESKGLLLEYTYMLTQGSRLTDVLRTQVTDRARDGGREIELAVLRVTTAAGATGATVDAERLPVVLKRTEAEISFALRRLLDEHLLRDAGFGRIGALHQLRATELFHLCHEFPPPTSERTIIKAFHCIPAEDIETFLVRACEVNAKWQGRLVDEIAARLEQEPDSILAAGALRGLGQVHISASVCAWLNLPEVRALPRTQVTVAAMFGLSGSELPDIPQLAHLQAASRSFCSAVETSAKNDPRKHLITRLTQETKAKLFSQQTNLSTLNELLGSIIGTQISNILRDQLHAIRPDLMYGGLDNVARLLGTASLIDPSIAEAWVDATGQQNLFNRIYNEVPWVSSPELRHEEEGFAVCADVRCVAASCQTDPHGEVVSLCQLLLAIVPQAGLAISNAVTPDGKIAGYGDYSLATKRIPRKNLPPQALPDWNKQWLTAVADRLAAPNYTDYLNRATELLHDLVTILESVLDEWFRKGNFNISKANCERLNFVNNLAETLTPPRISPKAAVGKGSAEKSETVTKLQSVLFDCSVNLIMRFNKLPEDANSYIAWTGDIIKHIDAAIENEPWELLSTGMPKELRKLRQIVEGLRLMAGESGVRNINPIQTWYKPKAQRKTAFRLASHETRSATERRLAKTRNEIKQALNNLSSSMNLYIRLKENEIAPWPPAEVLITLSIEDVANWLLAVAEITESLRACVGYGRNLMLVPLINGIAIDRLTVGGVDTLFPQEYLARIWLEQVGITVLDDIRARTFSTMTKALIEISGIKQFGYGTKDRPFLEQEALTSAYLELQNSLGHLRALLSSTPDILAQIEELVEQTSSGVIHFAADVTSSMHGEPQPIVIEVLAIQNELLRLDISNVKRR